MVGRVIPFCDVAARNSELRRELSDAFGRVAAGNSLILGPEVEAFEKEWAEFCGTKTAVGVGNGLEALTLILRGYGIGPGDEVIVPAHTCIATWMAVSEVGAMPVPVDCAPSGDMDMKKASDALTKRTAAIMPVHLYGKEDNLSLLLTFGPKIIVDAAQGHGLKELGHAAGFSFYPTKNLGALGDGGVVVTNDEDLADRIRLLRNYGSRTKNEHSITAGNSRLDEMQAAFLRVKLRRLELDNSIRARNAGIYFDVLSDIQTIELSHKGSAHVWHLFVIRSKDRERLRWKLTERGIGTAIHYPTPPHLQPAYKHLGYGPGSFPQAEAIARECLSLPIGPEFDEDAIQFVAEHVRLYAS